MSVTVQTGFPPVPEDEANEREHRRKLARQQNRINQGKFNATIDVTLSSTASTTVTDARIFATSYIAWMPQTDNAGLAFSSGINCKSSTQLKGSAVLTHGVSTQADRSFRILIIG